MHDRTLLIKCDIAVTDADGENNFTRLRIVGIASFAANNSLVFDEEEHVIASGVVNHT